jgi:hypothetical protein
MLLTLEKFDWTKKSINSALHKIMLENGETDDSIYFIMQQAPSCKVRELEDHPQDMERGDMESGGDLVPLLLQKENERKGCFG